MGKIRVGNKQNSYLNGEWAGHVRKDEKKLTSGIRRSVLKNELEQELNEIQMNTKAEEFRKKFGESKGSTPEIQRIYDDIEKVGDKCCNLIWHEPISSATLKELRKQGLSITSENGCYVITW